MNPARIALVLLLTSAYLSGAGYPACAAQLVALDTEEPRGGGVTWTGDSWLVAYVAAIPPYDQSSVFVRRFAKG